MASSLKNLSTSEAKNIGNVAGKRFGIVVTTYHTDITYALLAACKQTLLQHGASEKLITVNYAPGAFELPLSAQWLLQQPQYDAVICIGCVITGETKHDDYINNAVAQAIMNLGLKHNKPCIFGLLTPRNHQQALDRAGGKHGNKGIEIALAAIQMLILKP